MIATEIVESMVRCGLGSTGDGDVGTDASSHIDGEGPHLDL